MKKINIPIHRHTPKRYRLSRYIISGNDKFVGYKDYRDMISNIFIYQQPSLVTDLQRVPKKPKSFLELGMVQVSDKLIGSYFGLDFAKANPTKKLGFWRNLWQNKIRRGK